MVSENRQNRQCLGVPTDWNVPKFSLVQRIRAKHAFLNTIRIQTGLITGNEYFSPDSYWVTQHHLTRPIHTRISDQRTNKSPCHPVGVSALRAQVL